MRNLPYKLRTDAWWLGEDFTWSRAFKQAPLDPTTGGVISDRDFGETSKADDYREQYSDRR